MSWKNTSTAFGLGLAMLLVTGAAWAGGWGGGPGMGKGGGPCMGRGGGPGMGMGLYMIESLGLDEGQRKQVEALRAEHLARIEPIRAKLDSLRAELQALWQAERPDRNAILAKQDEMERQRVQLREARVDLRLEVQKLLTPEQRARAAELRKDRPGRGKFGRGMNGRGGHPGCPYAAGAGN